jgi:hypothetical protein
VAELVGHDAQMAELEAVLALVLQTTMWFT